MGNDINDDNMIATRIPETYYFTPDTFNIENANHDSNFLLLHQNILSFNAHSSEFETYIHQLDVDPDALVFSETWFKPNTCVDIPDYVSFHSTRANKNGGGVSIYVRKEYECNPLDEITINDEICETCAVTIKFHSANKIAIVGVYRPPSSSVSEFNIKLSNILSKLNSYNQILLVGDFNMDIGNPAGTLKQQDLLIQ